MSKKAKLPVVIFYANRIFEDIARSLEFYFRSISMEPEIVSRLDPEDPRLHIVFDANSLPPTAILPVNYIVYQLEQLSAQNNRWLTPEYLQILKRAKYVWDYSHMNIATLRKNGVNKVIYMPISYSPTLRHFNATEISKEEKDIDVLFFGGRNARRDVIIERLRARGVNAIFYDGGLWGEERVNMMKRARILLNVHYYGEDAILETARISVLLANRCFVISEPGSCPVIQKQYRDGILFSNYDNLVDTCIEWLKPEYENKRNRISNAGFTIFANQGWHLHGGFYQLCAIDSRKRKDSDGTSSGTVLAPVGSHQRIERVPVHTDAKGAQTLIIPDYKTEEHPLVSIVTITRNRKHFIGNVVHQVEKQDYPHTRLEWIVLDSSDSKEETDTIREQVGTFMRRVGIQYRVERLEPKTKGYCVSMARNRAIELTTGEYITFMDDDDYYFDNRISTAVRFLQSRPDKRCIGTLELPVYNMLYDTSIIMENNHVPEASMTFHRSLWEERKFQENVMGEGVSFLNERRNTVLDLPYMYNMIAITHGKNVTGKTRLYTGDKGKKSNESEDSSKVTSLLELMDEESQDIYLTLCTYLKRK